MKAQPPAPQVQPQSCLMPIQFRYLTGGDETVPDVCMICFPTTSTYIELQMPALRDVYAAMGTFIAAADAGKAG